MIIVGRKTDKNAVYIGRGSPLGNNSRMNNDSEKERNRVCEDYEIWISKKIANQDAMVCSELRLLYELSKKGDLMNAEILLQPNIPKPLHGINPRTIMGQARWDIFRQEAYASTNYHCYACGIHKSKALKHQWLEAHESYTIDYETGCFTLEKIVPLCHYCHSFIHNGLLLVKTRNYEITHSDCFSILYRGFQVLDQNNLPPNSYALAVCLSLTDFIEVLPDWFNKERIIEMFNKREIKKFSKNLDGTDFKLVFEGNEYKGNNKNKW